MEVSEVTGNMVTRRRARAWGIKFESAYLGTAAIGCPRSVIRLGKKDSIRGNGTSIKEFTQMKRPAPQ